MNKRPHFICLGAHKSGTSWLFNCLFEHPEIDIHDKIDYFYSPKKRTLGVDWYKDHFRSSNQLSGELSTVYFFSEIAAQEIHTYNQEIKLIVLLRNPIDRAYSHYLQDLKMGHISKEVSFVEALKKTPNMKLWGNYKRHLEVYKNLFPKTQLKIVLFDDIKQRPEEVIKEVLEFLEIETNFSPRTLNQKINPARVPKNLRSDVTARRISENLKKSKFGKKLWWRLKHSILSKTYYKMNSSSNTQLKLNDSLLRQELFEYFREDIEYIKQELNRPDLDWS